MEWIIDIVKALLTFAGVFVTVRYSLKGKKLQIANAHDEQIANVKGAFNVRLDDIGKKLDDIKTEQLKIGLSVTQLQKDVADNNNYAKGLNDRVSVLEKAVAALDNRESVSEHRLADLEKAT